MTTASPRGFVVLAITLYHSVTAPALTFTIRQAGTASWAVVNEDGRIVDRCVTHWDAAINALRRVEANAVKSPRLEA